MYKRTYRKQIANCMIPKIVKLLRTWEKDGNDITHMLTELEEYAIGNKSFLELNTRDAGLLMLAAHEAVIWDCEKES